MRGALAPAATGMLVRPAISTSRSALGRVKSNGTFPATGVMASIVNSGERIASSNARASSTPGSVSMMTREGPRPVTACPKATSRTKPLAMTTAADDVTNRRRVMLASRFDSMIFPFLFFGDGQNTPRVSRSPEKQTLLSWSWRLGHEFDVEIVQLRRVHIELNGSQPLVGRKRGSRTPEQRFSVAGAVVDIDVNVKHFLPSNDGGVRHRCR